eukprot:2162464-Rhodomonas_salina.1
MEAEVSPKQTPSPLNQTPSPLNQMPSPKSNAESEIKRQISALPVECVPKMRCLLFFVPKSNVMNHLEIAMSGLDIHSACAISA